jgi:hypothetical protein
MAERLFNDSGRVLCAACDSMMELREITVDGGTYRVYYLCENAACGRSREVRLPRAGAERAAA